MAKKVMVSFLLLGEKKKKVPNRKEDEHLLPKKGRREPLSPEKPEKPTLHCRYAEEGGKKRKVLDRAPARGQQGKKADGSAEGEKRKGRSKAKKGSITRFCMQGEEGQRRWELNAERLSADRDSRRAKRGGPFRGKTREETRELREERKIKKRGARHVRHYCKKKRRSKS